jgi:hypothetical protein
MQLQTKEKNMRWNSKMHRFWCFLEFHLIFFYFPPMHLDNKVFIFCAPWQSSSFICEWELLQTNVKVQIVNVKCIVSVTTLVLGSWPKQGIAKVRVESEAWESHFMLSGCRRMWGNELTHSQVGSHSRIWSPYGLPNFQRIILKVKIHWMKSYLNH